MTVTLDMPHDPFDGLLVGGLRFQKVQDDEAVNPDQAVAIDNQFAYVVGVIARNSQASIQPDLSLLDVFPNQLNYRNVISAQIQNYLPILVNQLKVEAKICE